MRWLNISITKFLKLLDKKIVYISLLLVLLLINLGFINNLRKTSTLNIYAFLFIINFDLLVLLIGALITFRKFIKLYYETKEKSFRTKVSTIILLYMFLPVSALLFISSFVVVESIKAFISDRAKMVMRTAQTVSNDLRVSQMDKAIVYRDFLEKLVNKERNVFSLKDIPHIRAINEVSSCQESIKENYYTYSICVGNGKNYYQFIVEKDISLSKSATELKKLANDFVVFVKTRDILNGTYVFLFLLISLSVVLFTFWFGIFLARNISYPIEELSEAAQEIATGNLDAPLPAKVSDDELGRLITSFSKMRDNLKELYSSLIREKDHLDILINSIPIGIAYIDKDGNIISFNKALKEIIKEEPKDIEFLNNLEIKGKTLKKDIIELSTKDKIFIVEDITPFVNLTKLSIWKETAQRVAHELKNPLTPIKLGIERIMRISQKNPEKLSSVIRESAPIMLKEIEDIISLLSQFRDFSSFYELKKEKFSLRELIESLKELYKPYNLNIKVKGDKILNADREKMKKVFVNLIQNSIESFSKNIYINIKPKELIYEDDGEGIKDEDINKIFLPYYSNKPTGSGLGLSIVENIIIKHGFEIKALPSNKGAVFVIKF